MKRLALACLLLAGCNGASPRIRQAVAPPLPEHPGNPPRISDPMPIAPLSAQWEVNAACRDVLEHRASLADDWEEIPGPYGVLDVSGLTCYRVPVVIGRTESFFRIRRDWGNPWVITPKIETKTESEK